MTTTRSTRSSSIESFYTAQSSYHSTNELNPFISLNGKSYHLTVYHKKANSDWENITQDYLKQPTKINFQQILQKQIKLPCGTIEITTSILPDVHSTCKVQCVDGTIRKIPFSLTKFQSTEILKTLEKIKGLKNSSLSSLSKESLETLNSSFVKMSLEEIKTKRVHDYLEETNKQSSIEPPNKKAHVKYPNKPESVHEALDSSSIKMSQQEVKTERINAKPIDHEQAIGLGNSGNNCCINALLQIILSNPELRKAWEECFPETRDLYYEALREGKSSAPQAVSNEFRKQLVQSSRFNLIDKSLFTQDDPTAFLEVFFNVCKEKLDLSHMKIYFEKMKYKQQIGGGKRKPTIEKAESHEQFRISIKHKLNRNTTLDELLKDHCLEINEVKENEMKVKYITEDRYVSLPDHLIIDLFTNNRKDAYDVCVPKNLSFPQDLLKDRHAYGYDLEGFVVHLGQSDNGGHYVAYRKVNGRWKKFDDSQVTNIDERQLQLILGNTQKPSLMQRWFRPAKRSYICMLSYSKKPSL